MGIEEGNRIRKICAQLDLHPNYIEHEAVITSQEAARIRGFELKQGVKAILFTNDIKFIMVTVPADKKVDTKKVAVYNEWSKSTIRMATPSEVLEVTGCEIGAVPPFGHKTTLQILADEGIFNNQESSFNIGLRTNSLKIKTTELKIALLHEHAHIGDFAQE